jgi:hypothetical protein
MLQEFAGSVIDQFVEYCSNESARVKLESRVVKPVMQYLAERFAWGIRVFQAVAVLVFIQTVVLVWLLLRECKRT